jgi:protein TonB
MSKLVPGAIDALDMPPTASQGGGDGGGAGTGAGRGDGPGDGSGLGPGRGHGGEVYGIGGGVTPPIELHRGLPPYTAEAMRARVQGPVLVECVVQTDGTCSDIRVLRSLDPAFGLDQEAIKAARQWRFRPGTRMGTPVPVLVTIEVTFTIR